MNPADTAWIIVATALVLFMTLPGLALFYGGLVRARNVLSVFMQCYAIACLMSLLWFAAGYSIAFGPADSGFWGRLGQSLSGWCRCRKPIWHAARSAVLCLSNDFRNHHSGLDRWGLM